MCEHPTPCPSADAADRDAAHVILRHSEQGWSLLCNGVIAFDDLGDLLPDGRAVPPPPVLPRPRTWEGQTAFAETCAPRGAARTARRPGTGSVRGTPALAA